MSVADARSFLTRLLTDDQFQSRILDASGDERVEVARGEGYDFTKAELESAVSELRNATVGDVAGEKREALAEAALAMLQMERQAGAVLLYGVVDVWEA